jgi:hypothetical protein
VWIEVVAVAMIMSTMSIAAHNGVRRRNARPAPHAISTVATNNAVACGKGCASEPWFPQALPTGL